MFSGVIKSNEFVCPPCSTSHNKVVFKIMLNESGRVIKFANAKNAKSVSQRNEGAAGV